jgi:hypothetical protein
LDRPDENGFERSPDKWVEWEDRKVWIVQDGSLVRVLLADVDLATEQVTIVEQRANSVGQAPESQLPFSVIDAVALESSRYTVVGTVLGLSIDIATVGILLGSLDQRRLR